MQRTVRCIAIDDEPLALDVIKKFCHRIGGIELQTFSNPAEGLAEIQRTRPDIAFLDIEMDNMNGLKVASQLPEETCFIFTTAYLHYALDGYDLDAVDYLHKPFSFARFQTAFGKAIRRLGLKQMQTSSQNIVIKQNYSNVTIPIDDIVYIEAMEGYSRIFRTSGECVTSRVILKNLCAMLPPDDFIRIHRSFVVSRSKVRSFNRQEIFLAGGITLPVGRQYAREIVDRLME